MIDKNGTHEIPPPVPPDSAPDGSSRRQPVITLLQYYSRIIRITMKYNNSSKYYLKRVRRLDPESINQRCETKDQ